MKKIILCAIMMIASITASAQVYLGGAFGVSREFSENKTEFTILPEIGYNLTDTWAIGTQIGYTHLYDNGLSTNLVIFSPYARYTFYKSENNLVNLFVDGGVDLAFGKSKQDGFSSDTSTIWGIGFKPGIAINPTDKFTILAHIGSLGYYDGNDAAKNAGVVSPNFGLVLNSLTLNLGFYYNF